LSQRRNLLSLLQPIRDDLKSQRLRSHNGSLSSLSRGHHAGKIENLTDPTAVFFPVDFDERIHRWDDS
jgi:hypothetical protein